MIANAEADFDSTEDIYICSVCRNKKLGTTMDGLLTVHGPLDNRCAGSKTSPLVVGSYHKNSKHICSACSWPRGSFEDVTGKLYCYEHFFAAFETVVSAATVAHHFKQCPFCGSKKNQVIEAAGVAYVNCRSCGATGPHGDLGVEPHIRWNDRQAEQ